VTESRGIKVYNVSSGKTLPQWLSEKKKKSLRKDEEYKSRIELIQDLEFDVASSHLRLSKDGKFMAATGVYPPQVKVYELSELSMKFERHMDCEVVQFQILSDDYSKMAFLQADRTIEFHAKFGTYYKTRVPKVGRDLCYDPVSCDLVVVGSSPDVYRLSLEQGRFLKPYSVLSPAINCVDRSDVHGLLAFGTESGTVECWDPRARSRVGVCDVAAKVAERRGSVVQRDDDDDASVEGVSAIRFDGDGLSLAAGTSGGYTALFDLRSSRPLYVKDQQYGQPIVDLRFHRTGEGSYLMAADAKILKVWEGGKRDGQLYASIEPPADINEVCLCPDSGLLMFATEQPRMHVYFVPALGPAPQWCSFLDSLTEELEETRREEVFEDYKFVTRDELLQLGLGGLVGTNMVKAYMHGFFLDAQLYARSKAVMNPFEYEEYRKKKIRDKVENKMQERIARKEPLPKVNRELAEKIMSSKEEEGKDEAAAKKVRSTDKKKLASQNKLLEDDRFKALFEKPEFQIDKESNEYKLLHPSEAALERNARREEEDGGEHFDEIAGLGSESESSDEEREDVAGDSRTALTFPCPPPPYP
ncbi:hypothetical protein GUITHDRAFT_64390, partial [Guillardia theta CCMP2712]